MGFLAPIYLALAGLAVPIIILYMLRLRRREVQVSSTFLWRLVVRDREANAPWQRLKRNLLLFLQLLILAGLTVALARPWVSSATVAQGNLVVLLDASASMQATDVAPSRFAAAQAVVRDLIAGLSEQDRVTLIAVGPQPAVLASQSGDKSALEAALAAAHPYAAGADWQSAFALAIAQARSTQSPTTVIVSDGGLPAGLPLLPGAVRFVRIGAGADNLAITALAARPASGGTELYIGISNSGDADADTVLDVALGAAGEEPALFDARNLRVPARSQAGLVLLLPASAQVVRAHVSNGGALALDDQAWAAVQQSGGGRVLLLTQGNTFLEKALALMPGVTTYRGDPGQPLPATPYDVTVVDALVPPGDALPAGNLLLIAPPDATPGLEISGAFSDTRVNQVAADHSIMQYVDTANLHIRQAQRIRLPEWATPLIEAEGGPLLFAGTLDNRRIAVLTFDLHDSDLPLQVAFPILLSNLLQWYAPAQIATQASVAPGEPLALQAPAGAAEVEIGRPDGSTWRGSPSETGLTFADTEQLGLYTIRANTPSGEVRQAFAVNLFSPAEADIRPHESVAIGGAPVAAAPAEAQGRREIWQWLAGAGVAVLVLEWWVYHRGLRLPRSAGAGAATG